MLNGSKEHNRNISKSDWKTIITFMEYKSKVVLLSPKNSTRRCSRCGWLMPRRERYMNVDVG
jgi:transposase